MPMCDWSSDVCSSDLEEIIIWPGPQTLELGTFPPFSEAQHMAEHLAAWSQALLLGSGVYKTQAMAFHQPPLPICSLIHPRALAHYSSHGVPGGSSCRELAFQSTTSFAHRRLSLVSVIQKSAFFSLPTSSLFGHEASLCEGTEPGSPGDKCYLGWS